MTPGSLHARWWLLFAGAEIQKLKNEIQFYEHTNHTLSSLVFLRKNWGCTMCSSSEVRISFPLFHWELNLKLTSIIGEGFAIWEIGFCLHQWTSSCWLNAYIYILQHLVSNPVTSWCKCDCCSRMTRLLLSNIVRLCWRKYCYDNGKN